MSDAALLVTLELDAELRGRFAVLRRAHYPPALDRVPAHCMLFHALPGGEAASVAATLAAVAGRTGRFAIGVAAPRSMGRGVQYPLEAPELAPLHAELVSAWAPWLTLRDRQGFRPHVVVQNKVAPEVARETLAALLREPRPSAGDATGLTLWRYLGGPWQHLRTFAFGEGDDGASVASGAAD